MEKIKHLAEQKPLAFAFVVTAVFILILFVSAVLGNVWPGEAVNGYGSTGGIVVRLVSIIILLLALLRLGWLSQAGFTRAGRWVTWLILLFPLAYAVLVAAYSMTGNFDFSFSNTGLTGSVTLFILVAAFLEEVAFRGLVLNAFVRVWGSTNRGLIQSVLVSCLFFGGIHLLDILSGRPLPNVLLQSLQAFFLGTFLGALVLSGKSIYPAVFFHVILNLAGYIAFGNIGQEPAASSWLLLSLLMFPLAVFGIYLLRGVPYRAAVPEAAQGVN